MRNHKAAQAWGDGWGDSSKRENFDYMYLIVAIAALDQHKGYEGPPLTGTIRLF